METLERNPLPTLEPVLIAHGERKPLKLSEAIYLTEIIKHQNGLNLKNPDDFKMLKSIIEKINQN